MAQSVSILLSAEDRERLSAIIVDRKSPLKHIQRANIVQRWPGLSEQGSAKDKWILCRLFSRDADLGRHAGRA
jgi:hypothetical protein